MSLTPGMPAPWFVAPSTSNPTYVFDTAAGRYVVLCFMQSAADTYARGVVDAFLQAREHFDDRNACFFGVSADPADRAEQRLVQKLPGFRYFWDFQGALRRLYRLDQAGAHRGCSFVLDPALRIIAVIPFAHQREPAEHAAEVVRVLDEQPRVEDVYSAQTYAPVIVVPRVFEPRFCAALIDYFNRNPPEESGFMQERNGKTIAVHDQSFKRRHDVSVTDESVRLECRARIVDRLKPEVYKAFQFTATQAERYIVSRYFGHYW